MDEQNKAFTGQLPVDSIERVSRGGVPAIRLRLSSRFVISREGVQEAEVVVVGMREASLGDRYEVTIRKVEGGAHEEE